MRLLAGVFLLLPFATGCSYTQARTSTSLRAGGQVTVGLGGENPVLGVVVSGVGSLHYTLTRGGGAPEVGVLHDDSRRWTVSGGGRFVGDAVDGDIHVDVQVQNGTNVAIESVAPEAVSR
ncbi:MAG: hypothetical protein KDC98_13040 [Planctomycetes bacterium]|nr:hypothetical protein [Planctomycetota bacterium]